MESEKLKERFVTFTESECKGHSVLYYRLSTQIANDEALLKIASHTRAGQPVPNIFLAAVHYLLLKDPSEALALYYPSIQRTAVTAIPFHLFKAFCLVHQDEIKTLISTRIVQTNVINRCAYLMPVFSKIIADEDRPATIIDIGTSAGLTLNFDQYEYWYNEQKIWGKSKVIVKSTIVQSDIPKIHPITQPITKKGIDQNIIDPADEDEILWLKALIWPDQLERFTAMEEALRLSELKNIELIRAQSITDFEKVIEETDAVQTLVICATHVLYQFSEQQKEEFYAMLERVGQKRDFYFLSVEGIPLLLERYHSTETVIELSQFKNDQRTTTYIAETNGHGNWIRWK